LFSKDISVPSEASSILSVMVFIFEFLNVSFQKIPIHSNKSTTQEVNHLEFNTMFSISVDITAAFSRYIHVVATSRYMFLIDLLHTTVLNANCHVVVDELSLKN